jgi:hypothetical protein
LERRFAVTYAMRILGRAALVGMLVPTILVSCGPKKGGKGPEGPSSGGKEGASASGKTGGELKEAVDALNAAIAQGDAKAVEALVVDDTLDLLYDVVAFSSAEEGGGVSSPGTAELVEFEKSSGVVYSYAGYDEDAGADMLQILKDDAVVGEGPVSFVEKGGKKLLDFEQAAQSRLEMIQSEGILRGKYIDVIDQINKAISDGDANTVKKLITIESLNLQLQVLSYSIKHKKNLSLQMIVDTWKNDGAVFEISDVDTKGQTAKMKLAAGDEAIYEGPCEFITEIGQLKLDFQEILKAKLSELEEGQAGAKKKKKGK